MPPDRYLYADKAEPDFRPLEAVLPSSASTQAKVAPRSNWVPIIAISFSLLLSLIWGLWLVYQLVQLVIWFV